MFMLMISSKQVQGISYQRSEIMVEWKKLGDVCELERGVRVIKKDLQEEGLIPVYQNSLTPLGYFDKSNYPGNTPFVICAGAAGEVGFCNKPFWAADDCTCILCSSSANTKYVYYCLLVNQHTLKSQVRKASVPRLSKDVIGKLIIPIPSTLEQERIVGILDTFTASIDNLKEQIAQRRKQYEYYRDQLLDLEGKEGVEMKTLGDIGDVCMCKRIMKEQTSEKGEIPFFKIGTFGYQADAYISKELFEEYKSKYSYPRKGEILISASGTIGRSVVFDGGDAYFQDSNIVWIANDEKQVSNRYLYYFYQVAEWKTDGGTIKRLYNYNLMSTIIPLPSLSEQQRIVSILDTFEASIQNLEAQLSKREKQYEYYRNKLLTFD